MRFQVGIAILAIALSTLYAVGWISPVDTALRDLRFQLDQRVPTGQVVLLEIDAATLEAVGVWPWPRSVHAEILDRLLDLGATDVAFDIDFSTPSSEEDDAAFEAALADAGGYAFLAGFRQLGRNGEAGRLTLPLPRFSQHASVVAVNVSADSAGIVRSIPYAVRDPGVVIPSLPAALGNSPIASETEFVIDYSIDPGGVDRIAGAELLAGEVAFERIADKRVIIGASALELRDVMMTPTHGPLPGALIQVLAAESLLQGRNLQQPSLMAGLVVLVATSLLLFALSRRLAQWAGSLTVLAASVALEACAFALQSGPGWLLDTAPAHALVVGGLMTAVAIEAVERRRLHLQASKERTEALERLARAATFDATTGVFTRQAFLNEIEARIRLKQPIAVVSVRLSWFERFAATLGRRLADPALREVVHRLQTLGPMAMGRVGNETFVLLVPSPEADQIAADILARLDKPLIAGDHRVVLSANVGIAYGDSLALDGSAESLIDHAELAREAAAASSQRTTETYCAELDRSFIEAQELQAALRAAVDGRAIELFLQGQVDLVSSKLIGAEALARWKHPRFGNVSPARFIPLAEQAGLAIKLGGNMLTLACMAAKRWPTALRVAVNFSPVQFEFDDVPGLIERTLELSGLDPSRLDIEITEGLVLRAHQSTLDSLRRIRQMGVGIALDDFGTGYSSLSNLSSLPINQLKIDQSFVRRLGEDGRVETIVDAILALCISLEITAVAEGIETEKQAYWLRRHGCKVGQGFLFHRPAPAADFSRLANLAEEGESWTLSEAESFSTHIAAMDPALVADSPDLLPVANGIREKGDVALVGRQARDDARPR